MDLGVVTDSMIPYCYYWCPAKPRWRADDLGYWSRNTLYYTARCSHGFDDTILLLLVSCQATVASG
ncbi:hypothetical protein J6590_018241 [Homalodisca vitripennis]|nr:hypothetical protein J6590_018241 [Homalodisca vitripennis]